MTETETNDGSGQFKTHTGLAVDVKHNNGMYLGSVNQKNIATASLHDEDPSRLTSISVDPVYRRHGVASALMGHIERHTGVKITNTSSRTPDGEDLWKSRNLRLKS